MDRHRLLEKIVGAILIVIGVAVLVYGQKNIDVPIVSDEPVATADTMRIVDKDEHQRVVNELVEKIQRLESRVAILEVQYVELKSQVEE